MPDAVFHVAKVGWKRKQNGELQQAAVAEGYTHLVTHDKDMADKHKPHLPVLVTDNPDHGEEGREPGTMTEGEIRLMTLAAAGLWRRGCFLSRPRGRATPAWPSLDSSPAGVCNASWMGSMNSTLPTRRTARRAACGGSTSNAR